MLAPSIPLLLALANLLFSTTQAAPTRTRCRCTILDSTSFSPIDPTTPPQDAEPTTHDICASLGPELESFRHTEPDLYTSYMNEASIAHSTTEPTDQSTTTVLLGITNRHGFRNLGVLLPASEPRPTERPSAKIVCRAESEVFSAYQGSFVTLAILQLIIALTILACVAEGVNMGMRWMQNRYSKSEVQTKPALRLLGGERRLRAFSADQAPSPGVEKKLRAYEDPQWMNRSPSQKHEFNAFEEDEDDEMNMPVM